MRRVSSRAGAGIVLWIRAGRAHVQRSRLLIMRVATGPHWPCIWHFYACMHMAARPILPLGTNHVH